MNFDEGKVLNAVYWNFFFWLASKEVIREISDVDEIAAKTIWELYDGHTPFAQALQIKEKISDGINEDGEKMVGRDKLVAIPMNYDQTLVIMISWYTITNEFGGYNSVRISQKIVNQHISLKKLP